MIARIAAEKVPEHFDRLLKQAERRGARAHILDRSRVVAAIVPIADIARLIGQQQRRQAHPYRILNVDDVRTRFTPVLRSVTTGKRVVVVEQDGHAVAAILPARRAKVLNNDNWTLPGFQMHTFIAEIEDAVVRSVLEQLELR